MERSGLHFPDSNQTSRNLLDRLPEALRGHVIQVLEKGEELVILTDSAAWAARLKLALAENPDPADNRRTSVKVVPRGAVSR
jgi:hypothetical protein